MRLGGRALSVGATMAAALVLASCSSQQTPWVYADDSAAWPGMYGDSRNASYADRDAARELVPAWTRQLVGTNLTEPAVSNRGTVSVTAKTDAGCTTFSLELTVGRKGYCRRDSAGVELRTPLVDQFEYTYFGTAGWLISHNPDNQIRWRFPTAGTPLWVKLAGDNGVLAVTHLGQVVLVDSHDGTALAPSIGVLDNVSADDNDGGLQDCPTNGPGCPVSGPPAVDTAAERAFVVVGSATGASKVVAVDYGKKDGKRSLRFGWERTDIADGVIGSPALSADGATLYVNLRTKKLAALDAKTGRTKWTHDLGYQTTAPPSVSASGVIIPASPGLQRSPFLALKDDGDSASEVFKRTDVALVSPVSQIRGDVGYAVVRSWAGVKPQLIEFRTDTGTTLRTFDLPDGVESASGVSIGPAGELVTVGSDGIVYAFTSGRRTGDSVSEG